METRKERGLSACGRWLASLARLFVPRRCVVCGACLDDGEEVLCLECDIAMPRTNYHLRADNPVEQRFWGRFPLERATSYFRYGKDGDYRRILFRMKYEGRKDCAEAMGRLMAADLARSGFFEGVDVLLPVPLHPDKQRRHPGVGGERAAPEVHGDADSQVGPPALGQCGRGLRGCGCGCLCRAACIAAGRCADHGRHPHGLCRCAGRRGGSALQRAGAGGGGEVGIKKEERFGIPLISLLLFVLDLNQGPSD